MSDERKGPLDHVRDEIAERYAAGPDESLAQKSVDATAISGPGNQAPQQPKAGPLSAADASSRLSPHLRQFDAGRNAVQGNRSASGGKKR